MRLGLPFLALLAVASLPAPASAAVRVEGEITRSVFDCGRGCSETDNIAHIAITADGRAPAGTTVEVSSATLTVRDPAGVTAAGACAPVDPVTADCALPTDLTEGPRIRARLTPLDDRLAASSTAEGPVWVSAAGEDGADTIDLSGLALPVPRDLGAWALRPDRPGARLIGGPGDDTLVGGASDDALDGGPGSDALDGGPGADLARFRDATGPVTASLAAGAAESDGLGGRDTLTAIEGLLGGPGDDALTGADTDDGLFGGRGADTIAGLGGDDLVADNRGWRSRPAEDADDVLDAGDGDDELYSTGGRDRLSAGPGDDELEAGEYGLPRARGTVACGDGFDTLERLDGARLGADCERFRDSSGGGYRNTVTRRGPWTFTLRGSCGANFRGSGCEIRLELRGEDGRLLATGRRATEVTVPEALRADAGATLRATVAFLRKGDRLPPVRFATG